MGTYPYTNDRWVCYLPCAIIPLCSLCLYNFNLIRHEIVGTVVRVGSKVKSGIKVGDRVGVGAQAGSCYECKCCKSGFENYCLKPVYTYVSASSRLESLLLGLIINFLIQNSVYPDGVRSQGGYSTGIIANEQFVFPIPDSVASADAASMLCGGLTVYSPLLHHGAGPGKKVGVLGIGGLVSLNPPFL